MKTKECLYADKITQELTKEHTYENERTQEFTKKHPYANNINEVFRGQNSCAIVEVIGMEGTFITIYPSSNPSLSIEQQLKGSFREDRLAYNYRALMIYPKINTEAEYPISLILGKLNSGKKVSESELANLLVNPPKPRRISIEYIY